MPAAARVSDMTLRATEACTLLVVLAGCLGGVSGDGTTPVTTDDTDTTTTQPAYETYVFDHAGYDAPAIEGGIRYPEGASGPSQQYATVVASESDAERFDRSVLDDGATAFVANTSFDDAYLVVVQEFPASSVPDYRVESVERAGDALRLRINNSSRGRTDDITVETLLVRVHGSPPERVAVTTESGASFDSTGAVARTPTTTRTTTTVRLPYVGTDPAETVAEPRDLRVENRANDTVGYRLSVTYTERPACRNETPPCGMPAVDVELLNRMGKLPEGRNLTVADVAAREGTYALRVEAEVPDGEGSRRTITESFNWRVDDEYGDAVVVINGDSVRLDYNRFENGTVDS